MSDFESDAEQAVDVIRMQNWKNGGTLSVDRPDAVKLFAQYLRTAYSAGVADGARETGDRMLATFDEISAKHGQLKYRGYEIAVGDSTPFGNVHFAIDGYDGAPDSGNRGKCGVALSVDAAKKEIDEQIEMLGAERPDCGTPDCQRNH
jgi:hypothetical protein